MESTDPISYSLDVKLLGSHGQEVLVTVVNEGEDWLLLKGAHVDITKDGKPWGRHALWFTGANQDGTMRLGQFETATGHFHLAPDPDHHLFKFQAGIDYRYGDHDDTQRLTKQVETQQITRKKSWW